MKVCCTVEEIKYGAGIPLRWIYPMYDGRYFQHFGGYSMQWRDIISTMKGCYKYSGEFCQNIERYSVLLRGIISILGIPMYDGEYSVQFNILHQLH